MQLPTLKDIEAAQSIVYSAMPPTPQYSWPLLTQRLGRQAFIKHENHSPVGAFKLRGSLVYATWLKETRPDLTTLKLPPPAAIMVRVLADGAARLLRIAKPCLHRRSPRQQHREESRHAGSGSRAPGTRRRFSSISSNTRFFEPSLNQPDHAQTHAMVESFHPRLVAGTATYALEFFGATPPLSAIYVPIGLGSSICGVSAVRNALRLKTEIVGVVAAGSPSYALSFRERRIVEAPSKTQIADGLACRLPNADAMQVIWENVARIVEVSDAEIAAAIRVYYHDTHNIAEGAAAAALAGAIKEKGFSEDLEGKPVGIVFIPGGQHRPRPLHPGARGVSVSSDQRPAPTGVASSEELTPLFHGAQNHCFGCGAANPAGLKLDFSKSAEGAVVSQAVISDLYEGSPGYLHGGIIATLLDEANE